MLRDKDTPLRLVEKWSKAVPEVYQALNLMRSAKGEGEVDWPAYCYLPIGAAFTYLVDAHELTAAEAATVAGELTICYSWQNNAVLYNFDSDLTYLLLEKTPHMQDSDIVPTEIFLSLPSTGVYIRTDAYRNMDGFWAWIEYDWETEITELRVQWVSIDLEHSIPMPLRLIPGATLRECVLDTLADALKHSERRMLSDQEYQKATGPIISALQLLLYLLSKNADIETEIGTSLKTGKDGSIRIQKTRPGKVKVKKVGEKIGNAIRQSLPPLDPGEQQASWEFSQASVKWLPPAYLEREQPDNIIAFPKSSMK